MGSVTVILVRDDGSLIDTVIEAASGGAYCHAALRILGSTLESSGLKDEHDLYPGVWLHPPGKFDGANALWVEVELPDLAAAEEEARRLLGTVYGLADCVRGGLYDLLGVELDGNTLTANCSETVVRVLRAGGLDVLPGVPADCVTPNDLGRWFGGQTAAD